jgi:AraC family transcriptional regulator
MNKENLKAIPPISFQITVKGENRMNYNIISKEQFKVAGVSKHITSKNGENFKIIPRFWDEVCARGTYKILDKNQGNLGILGISHNFNNELDEFDYIISVEGDTLEGLSNFEVVNIPKNSWAVFESIGPMPHAIQDVIHRIYAEWFPATKYEHAGGPELEVYLPGDPSAEDYKCEVWIPVIEKA